MLAFKSSTTESLVRVVNGLTGDPILREDLLQEATIHFWKSEMARPGQTLSWYLQSCSFHLRHYLQSGRSVDSCKRRALRVEWPEDEGACEVLLNSLDKQTSVEELVQTREFICQLCLKLNLRERTVLCLLDRGLSVRQIAKHLNISHPLVLKCRRRIANLAICLGVNPASTIQNGSSRSRSDHSTRIVEPAKPVCATNGHGPNGRHHNKVNGNGHGKAILLATQQKTKGNGRNENGYGYRFKPVALRS